MDDAVKKLFAEYERLFSALDVEGQAKFFADSFISAGPRGAIAQSKAELLKMEEGNWVKRTTHTISQHNGW